MGRLAYRSLQTPCIIGEHSGNDGSVVDRHNGSLTQNDTQSLDLAFRLFFAAEQHFLTVEGQQILSQAHPEIVLP